MLKNINWPTAAVVGITIAALAAASIMAPEENIRMILAAIGTGGATIAGAMSGMLSGGNSE